MITKDTNNRSLATICAYHSNTTTIFTITYILLKRIYRIRKLIKEDPIYPIAYLKLTY